jgi:hypothetical protein
LCNPSHRPIKDPPEHKWVLPKHSSPKVRSLVRSNLGIQKVTVAS